MLNRESDQRSTDGGYVVETGAVLFLILLIIAVLVIAVWSGVLLSLGLTDTAGPLEMLLDVFSFAQWVQAGRV